MIDLCIKILYFFFNDTATTEIYTLSLRDALPICGPAATPNSTAPAPLTASVPIPLAPIPSSRTWSTRWTHRAARRSEEHTSELQSRQYLVCRLLLVKKKYISMPAMTSCLHLSIQV